MRLACAWLAVLAAAWQPAMAEDVPVQAHDGGRGPKPSDYRSPGAPPPGREIRKYAEDEPGKPQENFGVVSLDDNEPFFRFLADRLEYRSDGGRPSYLWETDTWYGTDYDKLFIESQGEYSADGRTKDANLELYWNHTFAAFWDTQLGLRHDFKPYDSRTFLAAGVQGLAPYVFNVDATAYVSEEGDASAKLEVERSFLLTQRLSVIPRLETNLALQEVREFNIGSGINNVELDLRMSYQVTRKFAPYIGVSWRRDVGETASLKRADGEDTNATAFVTGVKLWF
jgi:copper resistance protein B